MKYTIEVNKEQLRVVADSLDLYSRLKCGRLDMLEYLFINKKFDRESVDYVIQQLKILLFPDLLNNESYGIYSDKTPRESKVGYGIYKNIQYELHKNDKEWNTHKDYPLEADKEYQCKVRKEE